MSRKILGGWQTGGTFEYQPGALLEFGNNVFFNGDLDDIAKDNPEIALNRDGTLDQSKYWFNTGGLRHGGGRAAGVVPEARVPVHASTACADPGCSS